MAAADQNVGPLDSIPPGEDPIMSNRKQNQQKRPHRNAFQLLMAKKLKYLVAAEKTYWEAISSLVHPTLVWVAEVG